jgi:peroxiredoxin
MPAFFVALALATLPAPRVGDFDVKDVRGVRHAASEWAGQKAVVLFFLGTECPVSNGYAPEMARLAKAYGREGVAVWGVHPDPDVTPEAALRHAREYALDFPIFLDPRQTLTRQAGVRVTPEAAVLSPSGVVLYRGRIDDRYSLSGKRRREPSTRDLEDALRAALAGHAVAVPRTRAYGCPLPQAAAEPASPQKKMP